MGSNTEEGLIGSSPVSETTARSDQESFLDFLASYAETPATPDEQISYTDKPSATQLSSSVGDEEYMPAFGNSSIFAGVEAEPRYDFEDAVGEGQSDSDGWGLLNIGKLAYSQRDYTGAQTAIQQGLDIFFETGDTKGIPIGYYHLGKVVYREGNRVQAKTYFQEALNRCKDGADKNCLASTLWYLGKVSYREDNFDYAKQYFAASLTWSKDIGDKDRIAWTLNYLGKVCYRLKQYPACRTYFKEALPYFEQTEDKVAIAACLLNLAKAELKLGRSADANLSANESSAIYTELNDNHGILACLKVIDSSEEIIRKTLNITNEIEGPAKNIVEISTPEPEPDYQLCLFEMPPPDPVKPDAIDLYIAGLSAQIADNNNTALEAE